MEIQEQISRIMEKMEKLSGRELEFSCGDFPPKWGKPLKENAVAAYEKANGIQLPEDYRQFITTVAGSGTQPFYGLYSLFEGSKKEEVNVSKKFPYTVRKPCNLEEMQELSAEEYDAAFEEADAGYVFLCHEGCGMYSVLIVNTEDKETYGTVWYYDLANDAGIYPLIHPDSKKTMSFLDWLEYYVDQTLRLDKDDYFSYGELAGVLEE